MTSRPSRYKSVFILCIIALAPTGCNNRGTTPNVEKSRTVGQNDFTSRPVGTNNYRLMRSDIDMAASEGMKSLSPTSTTTSRAIEETDIYRLEGERLYYLNSYRGLMVFDVSNVDQPKLIGRSPIYGDPVEMIVHNGIASVVVSDWYGVTTEGKPFHGSIVRGIDTTNPTEMKILGEAMLGGWVRDTRVVGDVLYAVTEQYSWDSTWYGTVGMRVKAFDNSDNTVAVTSVDLAHGTITPIDRYEISGQGGIFYVTENAIMLASNEPSGQINLKYLDISDAEGNIQERGNFSVNGTIQGWGADNGRWNLDFSNDKTAHIIACAGTYCGAEKENGLILSIVDFSQPDAPVQKSTLNIPSTSWSPTARFDSGRMYLSPSMSGCYYDENKPSETPVQIYDLSDSAAPRLTGSVNISGQIWLFMPAANRLFALGNDCNNETYGSNVSLGYLNVTDPSAPRMIGTATFGQGWAWTPAAGTFKAFTKNDAEGLIVLPFSGWDTTSSEYNNGLQLIEFNPDRIVTSGTAKSHGWVERGIFVKNRLVSLSDLSLAVIDYSDHAQPKVISELTLARNIVDVKPQGTTVAELSSDFWDNDQQHSMLRILPISQAEENVSNTALAETEIDGYNSRVFHYGNFSYVVSNIQYEMPCSTDNKSICSRWTQRIEIVERTNDAVIKRGKLDLPDVENYWYGGWGWYGCYSWDWYQGEDIIQVDGNALVFRRWLPAYANNDQDTAVSALYVVDLSNPEQPSIASTTITNDLNSWWGNLRAVGDKLYAGHYEWVQQPVYDGMNNDPGVVRYYLDQIDLSDRTHPRVGAKINVPGIFVGADENDSSIIFTMDYRWDNDVVTNRFEVSRIQDDRAYWQGGLDIPGQVGNTFVQGSTAYFTVQGYDDTSASYPISLYQIDLSTPTQPVAFVSENRQGWGWLLGVQGDRAFVTSGWGDVGIDVFRLQSGQAPIFEQFIRTRGWWTNSLARQDNHLFLASGYWGVQILHLEE